MTLRRPRSFVLLLPLIGVAVYTAAAPPRPAGPTPAEAAFLRENDVAMNRMMSAMQVHPTGTGNVDRDFADMMIPHHQGGIDMARALLRYGKDERMKALAREIIAKQEQEIARMHQLAGASAGTAPGHPMSMPMSMPMPPAARAGHAAPPS